MALRYKTVRNSICYFICVCMSPNLSPADGRSWDAALHLKILIYAVSLNCNTLDNVLQAHAVLRRGFKQEFPVYKESLRTWTTPKRVIPLQALTKSKDKVIFKPLLRKCFVLRKVACNSQDGPTYILRRQRRFELRKKNCFFFVFTVSSIKTRGKYIHRLPASTCMNSAILPTTCRFRYKKSMRELSNRECRTNSRQKEI